MAKVWGLKAAEIYKQQKRRYSEVVGRSIDVEIYKKVNTPKPGIKSSVMMVYAEKGKLAAWQVLQEYNKKLSGTGFTLEMLEQWIGEYEKRQNQKAGKDNGYDR